ncbi:MAG: DUF4118 domain-containing protein, partial [Candidatus Eisenbacteria bacterium]
MKDGPIKPEAAESRGYLIAVISTAAAILLRWLLDPWLGDRQPLVPLLGAVAAAAVFGGYRPALIATVLGFLAADYLFYEPRHTFVHPRDYFDFGLYLITCVVIIVLSEGLRRARRLATERSELLR